MLGRLYLNAVTVNHQNIFSLLEKNSKAKLLDLGCDDGKITLKLAKHITTIRVYGIDIVEKKLKLAKKNGIKPIKSDLNKKLPLKDNYFDIVHANQVIEHLIDIDNFVDEIKRVLKPKGYAVISTENGSSLCNIVAAIMGWQIFSLTNVSRKRLGIGNPLAYYRNKSLQSTAWLHKTIFNFRGLKELFEAHGFKIEKVKGAGYFPLPSFLGKIDKVHSHFITIKVRKK